VLDRQRRRLLFFAVFNGIDIALAEMSAITALISSGSSFAIDGDGAIVGPLGQTPRLPLLPRRSRQTVFRTTALKRRGAFYEHGASTDLLTLWSF